MLRCWFRAQIEFMAVAVGYRVNGASDDESVLLKLELLRCLTRGAMTRFIHQIQHCFTRAGGGHE